MSAEDEEILSLAREKPHLIVLNKSDLPPIKGMPEGLLISTLTGQGIDALKRAIVDAAGSTEPGRLSLSRHIPLARLAAEALEEAARAMQAGEALDLCAVHLHEALYRLGEVTGDNVTEVLLDQVFSSFCVGK